MQSLLPEERVQSQIVDLHDHNLHPSACLQCDVMLTPYCRDASSEALTSGWYVRARRLYEALICALLAVGHTCKT